MTQTGIWVGVALLSIIWVGLAGCVYGYHSEVAAWRELVEGKGDSPGLLRKVVLLEGRLNQLANRVLDNEQAADTGPISLLDRPSPAQIADPTRPDLEAQKPPVQRTGATAVSSGGRHRAAA